MSEHEKKPSIFSNLRAWIIGSKLNPFNPEAFRSIALISFLAWIGLGADGLSSSCYGPEESFLALGDHTHLALIIALATMVTVFVISLGYNQVVELFPSGGGGYRVATELLGPKAGLISGSALIVDYVLTIAISIASGVDALFSLLPLHFLPYKEITEIILIGLLGVLNLRGMKESIKILMPIFLSFVLIHIYLIFHGVIAHSYDLRTTATQTFSETKAMYHLLGFATVAAFLLHSYSMGSGTYTGLEAVSNNVNRLAEPRIRTAKITMLMMAISLSFMAGGIMTLYLIWHATPVAGQTLNAVVFGKILGTSHAGEFWLAFTLLSEAGILFVAANTGFLAGPVVLANMAIDNWVPNRFRHLSSRLVTQNGIILFGLGAGAIILLTRGEVSILVILYSINVFLTFTLSMLGLCVYWYKHKSTASKHWVLRLLLSIFGFFITSSILCATLSIKFMEGGWFTVVITSIVIGICLLVKKHYALMEKKLNAISESLTPPLPDIQTHIPELHKDKPTAVYFMGGNSSIAMHTFLWSLRMFPEHFENFIFVSVGEVDIQSFSGAKALEIMKQKVENNLNYFVSYCQQHGMAAAAYSDYGTDTVNLLLNMAENIATDYQDCIFFASKLIFEDEHWYTRILHNETPNAIQRGLHAMGRQLIILPMKV